MFINNSKHPINNSKTPYMKNPKQYFKFCCYQIKCYLITSVHNRIVWGIQANFEPCRKIKTTKKMWKSNYTAFAYLKVLRYCNSTWVRFLSFNTWLSMEYKGQKMYGKSPFKPQEWNYFNGSFHNQGCHDCFWKALQPVLFRGKKQHSSPVNQQIWQWHRI